MGSSPVELDLVDGPHCPLDVLQAHEALVKAEVVPDGVLQVEDSDRRSETAPRVQCVCVARCHPRTFQVAALRLK